ncbi:MAG TPA: FAD-dependent oxidoreductase, partial [Schlesneria sp.]
MSEFDFDAIVVGQGLAGTALAWNLTWRDQRVLVIDRDEPVTSSRVAAGLMTPITGKKLVPSWRWDRFWNSATKFYRRVEQQTSSSFFYPQRIVRLLATSQEQQYFARRVESEFGGLAQQPEPLVSSAEFDNSLGGFEMVEGGRLAVLAYLAASREYFQRDDAIMTGDFDPNSDVELTADGVRIPRLDISARRLIFCQGIDAVSNRWFQNIDFKPAKGEILTVRVEGLAEERIVSHGVWLMPLGDGLFRAGATYEWKNLDSIPTNVARLEICQRLRDFLRFPFSVVGQDAAVRP